ncbi:MAG: hypothetical protein JSR56_06080 [Proteobacteria bacterium]|nr:hypothetical protein [Pseudomonadota bacterium]
MSPVFAPARMFATPVGIRSVLLSVTGITSSITTTTTTTTSRGWEFVRE